MQKKRLFQFVMSEQDYKNTIIAARVCGVSLPEYGRKSTQALFNLLKKKYPEKFQDETQDILTDLLG